MAKKIAKKKAAAEKKPAAEAKAAGMIELSRLRDAVVEVPIKGLTPVIPHRWSEKAKRMMPGHPDRGKVEKVKEVRKPKEEAEACLYKLDDDGLGIPAPGFKAAIIGACRFFKEPTMVEAKQLITVEGEGPEQLVRIKGTRELHEDTVRNANGSADLRYRYYILGWTALLRVRYVPERISRESVVALIDAGGRGGVGDWRPSAPKSMTGTYGTFRIDEKKEVRDVS